MASLRNVINAKCKSCIYDPDCGAGTWREQVAACSSSNCPLHAVRPESAAKRRRGAPKSTEEVLGHTLGLFDVGIGAENDRIADARRNTGSG